MTRKYTKRDCNYWGHKISFLNCAIDDITLKPVAYYGICRRCNKPVFLPTNGKVDLAACRHLVDITLQDLPKFIRHEEAD